ncbi:hypothetical protein [Prevotella rectalis]|uniref:hypothetical protein n=1 Tax=Prevotella rectalis TaxID=2219999 RepID=UPI0010307FB1|nr:hypothetical protein [Prevotella brunnea]
MERKSFEELELLKQEGRIGWVEFLLQSEYGESYKLWLNDRGAEADEDNAELFLEQTDASFFDNLDFLM